MTAMQNHRYSVSMMFLLQVYYRSITPLLNAMRELLDDY